MSDELKPIPLRVVELEKIRERLADIDAKQAELIKTGQKLLARIRPTSKYHGQGTEGSLFPVCIGGGNEYLVLGGPGGKYRLSDVDLFAVFVEDQPPTQITFAT